MAVSRLRVVQWLAYASFLSGLFLLVHIEPHEESLHSGALLDAHKQRTLRSNCVAVETLYAPLFPCDGDDSSDVQPADVIILVTSAVDNREQRDAIRNTWGRHLPFRDDLNTSIRLVFVLGRPIDDVTSRRVERETKFHRDVIVGDFVDSYQNLTLKSLYALRWSEQHCTSAQYNVKTDDDVFVNIAQLDAVISEQIRGAGSNMIGACVAHAQVMRAGRWKLSESSYKPTHFPPYCNGAIYVIKTDVIPRLLSSACKIRHLPIEDVYVTGVLARSVGVTCEGDARFPLWLDSAMTENVCRLVKGNLVAIHNVHFTQMQRIQNVLREYQQNHKTDTCCSH